MIKRSYTDEVDIYFQKIHIVIHFKEESNDNQRGYGEKTHGKKV